MTTCRHCGFEHSDQLLRCPKCDAKTATARRMDHIYGELEHRRRMGRLLRRVAVAAAIGVAAWYAWMMASGMAEQRWGSAPPAPEVPGQ